MKCINKICALFLVGIFCINATGCQSETTTEGAYQVYETSAEYSLLHTSEGSRSNLFSSDLCVTDGKDINTDKLDPSISGVASGAGVFDVTTKKVLYSQNIMQKLYPASTTKILTALMALKYGDLNKVYTVSENACNQASDSSICDLKPGDQMTLQQLLYGMMLRSGNDAAIAIAEGVGGSVDNFVKLMNEEAAELGATDSHFVTPNGLHNEEHYTTVYDMYLIFNAALKSKEFQNIIQAKSYDVQYKSADGSAAQMTWNSTNMYLSGKKTAPDSITVLGGKTGTTGPAGYCLVLLSKNAKNETIISIVFHADCRANLYYLMNQMLEQCAVK